MLATRYVRVLPWACRKLLAAMNVMNAIVPGAWPIRNARVHDTTAGSIPTSGSASVTSSVAASSVVRRSRPRAAYRRAHPRRFGFAAAECLRREWLEPVAEPHPDRGRGEQDRAAERDAREVIHRDAADDRRIDEREQHGAGLRECDRQRQARQIRNSVRGSAGWYGDVVTTGKVHRTTARAASSWAARAFRRHVRTSRSILIVHLLVSRARTRPRSSDRRCRH